MLNAPASNFYPDKRFALNYNFHSKITGFGILKYVKFIIKNEISIILNFLESSFYMRFIALK